MGLLWKTVSIFRKSTQNSSRVKIRLLKFWAVAMIMTKFITGFSGIKFLTFFKWKIGKLFLLDQNISKNITGNTSD